MLITLWMVLMVSRESHMLIDKKLRNWMRNWPKYLGNEFLLTNFPQWKQEEIL